MDGMVSKETKENRNGGYGVKKKKPAFGISKRRASLKNDRI